MGHPVDLWFQPTQVIQCPNLAFLVNYQWRVDFKSEIFLAASHEWFNEILFPSLIKDTGDNHLRLQPQSVKKRNDLTLNFHDSSPNQSQNSISFKSLRTPDIQQYLNVPWDIPKLKAKLKNKRNCFRGQSSSPETSPKKVQMKKSPDVEVCFTFIAYDSQQRWCSRKSLLIWLNVIGDDPHESNKLFKYEKKMQNIKNNI